MGLSYKQEEFLKKMEQVKTFYEKHIDESWKYNAKPTKLKFEHLPPEENARKTDYYFVKYQVSSKANYQITFISDVYTVSKYCFEVRKHLPFKKNELELFDKLGFDLDENHTRETQQTVEDWF